MLQTVFSWRPAYWVTAVVAVWTLLLLTGWLLQRPVEAETAGASERVVTVYDNNLESTFVTKATTVDEALQRSGFELNTGDITEPSMNTELVAKNYHINIYRARPVTVVNGNQKTTVVTPKQSGRDVVKEAGVSLHHEDTVTIQRVDDVLADGTAVQRATVNRATAFQFTLYGEQQTARTQAGTVGEFLDEIEVELASKDRTSLPLDAPIKAGMKLELWREGKQTITVKEKAPFPVKQIEDPTREVGYREVKVAGEPGKRKVVYEIVIEDGKEVSRKKIQSVITTQPVEQVEVVGTKPSFSGDFAEALAKLRSCEGGYDSWNSAGPYYGAYQFSESTWATVADPARYGNATPAEQDEAARRLYERRGWQPWPVCGADLPDVYR